MLNSINFPNLGIELESVNQGISFLGINISYYGILMALAILVGMGVILLEARYTGQHPEDYLDMAMITIPAAIIGARIYYVIFSWDIYKDSILQVFAVWKGGLAMYGGLIAGFFVICIFANTRSMWTPEVLDTVSLGLLAGQAIASWGSYFNRESFGEYTNALFAMQLPIDSVRIADVTDRMRNHLVELDGVRYIQVHPLFLYQFIWCLVLLILLIIYRYNKEFDGEIFCLYMAGYSAGRIWMEGLRTDALTLPGLGWPVSRIVAIICLIISVAVIVYNRRMDGKGRMRRMRQKNTKLSMGNGGNMFHGM